MNEKKRRGRPKKFTPQVIEQVKYHFITGKSITEIIKIYNCSERTLRRWIKKYFWIR